MQPERASAFEVVGPNHIRLHVLSYNIKGLPAPINPGWDQDRFRDIGKILAERRANGSAPDLVFLQESFGARTLELQREAGYPFHADGPANTKPMSSGLFILSNFPLTYSESLLYGNFECGTWDCFASKGALAVRVSLPGVPLELLLATTHAQAERAYDEERARQLRQLAGFLKALTNPEVGLIVGGDFNTTPSQTSYQTFIQTSGYKSVGETCLDPQSGCELLGRTNRENLLDRSMDQFFTESGSRVFITPTAVERNFQELVNGRRLSDHFGYEATFDITWN